MYAWPLYLHIYTHTLCSHYQAHNRTKRDAVSILTIYTVGDHMYIVKMSSGYNTCIRGIVETRLLC